MDGNAPVETWQIPVETPLETPAEPSQNPAEPWEMGGCYCIVPGCTNTFFKSKYTGAGHHYHGLPVREYRLRKLWLDAIKSANPYKHVPAHARVCSDHFMSSDYVEAKDIDADALADGRPARRRRNRLKKDAVPSVFVDRGVFEQHRDGESELWTSTSSVCFQCPLCSHFYESRARLLAHATEAHPGRPKLYGYIARRFTDRPEDTGREMERGARHEGEDKRSSKKRRKLGTTPKSERRRKMLLQKAKSEPGAI